MLTKSNRAPWRVGILAALVLCAAFLSFATTATATGSASLSTDATVLTFTAGSGDTNNLTLSFNGVAYVLEEPTVAINAGTGCAQVTSTKVSCASLTVVSATLDMGDQIDTATIDPTNSVPSHVETTINNVGSAFGADGPIIVNSTDGGYSSVIGGAGYDTLNVTGPYTGAEIEGGTKDDTITIKNSIPSGGVHESAVSVTGNDGADLIDASESTGNLTYVASEGTDVLLSGDGSDEITFGEGRDLIFGNGGDDRIYDTANDGSAESNLSEVWGGPGNDTFIDMNQAQMDVTHFEGGPGIDAVTYNKSGTSPGVHISLDLLADDGVALPGGGSEGDHIHQSVENIGNYALLGGGFQLYGSDTLIGSPRPNTIFGHNNNDTISGLAGNDVLDGGQGNDAMDGGTGDDTLKDILGTNTLTGGDGNDELKSGSSTDALDGGNGDDLLNYGDATSAVTVSLANTSAQSTGGGGTDTLSSIENLWGSAYNDTLTGSSVSNKIDGKNGNDVINATDGVVDYITCGSGTDTVDADTTDVIVDGAACESVTTH